MEAADTKADFDLKASEIVNAGRYLHQRGWVPATSSNFSARLEDGDIAITVSGYHKGLLNEGMIMRVDLDGKPVGNNNRPSAESPLHLGLFRRDPAVGAVLHTHSVNATVLSRDPADALVFEQYEIFKAFSGIKTHDTRFVIPIFDNDQDVPRLATKVDEYMDGHPPIHAYLIRGHGLYTWGKNMREALTHLEALEFLFECQLTAQRLQA